jgi:hypothetical protein
MAKTWQLRPRQQLASPAQALPKPLHVLTQESSALHADEQHDCESKHASPRGVHASASVPPSGGQQGAGCPQLSMQLGLQATAIGVQQVPWLVQTSDPEHPQATSCPHPSSTYMAQLAPQGSAFGVQHLPASSSQTPPSAHCPPAPQVTG